MLRRLAFVAISVALFAGLNSASADVFVSGQADMNASTPGATQLAPSSKRLDFNSGGVSYGNVWTGVSGTPQVGDKITVIGAVTLQGGQDGNMIDSFVSGSQLIAIFALEGSITNNVPTNLTASFKALDGGSGVIHIFDRASTGGFVTTDPSTWVQNINNLSTGLLAEMAINGQPTGLVQGPPGSPETQSFIPVNLGAVNTSTIDTTGAIANNEAFFLLDITDPGLFFANFNIVDPSNPQLFVQLPESITDAAPDVSELNTLFAGLMGGAIFSGVPTMGTPGAAFNPTAGNGDLSLLINGGNGIPGSGQPFQEVPEPASMLVWGVGMGIAGVMGLRRRRNKAKA